MRALVIALTMIATPAAAADQFDLICKSEVKLSPDGRWKTEDARYRIDVAAGRWCEGACNGSNEIAAATDKQLTLIAADRKLPSDPYESLWLDRLSGDLHYLRTGGIGRYKAARGKCQMVTFTGFPDVQRKF